MWLWLATALASLRGCRVLRALEPEQLAAPFERATAQAFHAYRSCVGQYRVWQTAHLPAKCRHAYEEFVLHGVQANVSLPAWREALEAPPGGGIAYLVSVAKPDALPLVVRTFRKLYRPADEFLYLVDAAVAPGYAARLREALPNATNVAVREVGHSPLYFWPRVEIVLTGLASLRAKRWSYAVHLSESDYPLHGAERVRALATDPARPLVLQSDPVDGWWWWREHASVFNCAGLAVPDAGVHFPEASLAKQASLHRGSEWFALPREVIEYALDDAASLRAVLAHRWAADEIFWPTLVASIPRLARKVVPGWYIAWDFRSGHSPDVFLGNVLSRHEVRIMRSPLLFIRKVALPGSEPLLAALDRRA